MSRRRGEDRAGSDIVTRRIDKSRNIVDENTGAVTVSS
jgi:hypothetical protein